MVFHDLMLQSFGPHRIFFAFRGVDLWFPAFGVCNALGYSWPEVAPTLSPAEVIIQGDYEQLGDSPDVWQSQRNVPRVGVDQLWEGGVYDLILRSPKPAAQPFQEWVTRVVLPTVFEDGGYFLFEGSACSVNTVKYYAVLQGDRNEGDPPRNWVCSVVLPLLRRYGHYLLAEQQLAAGAITSEEYQRGGELLAVRKAGQMASDPSLGLDLKNVVPLAPFRTK